MKKNPKRWAWNIYGPTKTWRIMRLTSALVIFSVSQLLANTTYSQSTKLTLNMNNVRAEQILDEIENKSDFYFLYNQKLVDLEYTTNASFIEKDIFEILEQIFKERDIYYKVVDRQIILSPEAKKSDVQQTERTIRGNISDQFGSPIPGASIIIKGTTHGTISDMNGVYTLAGVPDNSMLVISFVGMKSVEILADGRTTINITLQEESIGLDEIVAIGYGVLRKSDLTGATSRLTEDNMNKSIATSPIEMMQGRIAGVNIVQNSGEPGSGMSVRIRGANSIRSGQEPLYVIDGVPLDNTNITPSGGTAAGINQSSNKNPISFLNPDDIESIDILKDASSTAIYGARGANGVVLITTKKGKLGEGTMNYDGYTGVARIREQLDVLSAQDFRSYRKSDGTGLLDLGASNNWQDEIYRTAITQSHNLSYGGGTQNMTYRASLGYIDQEGIVKNTGSEKLNGQIRVTQNMFNGKLGLSGNLIASHVKDLRAPISETGGYEGDLILTVLKLNPTYPIYNNDGSYYQHSRDQRNPAAMLDLTNDLTETDRIIGNISADLEILTDLKYKLNVGFDRTVAERRVNQGHQLTYLTNKGEANINSITVSNQLIENYFTYNKTLGGQHRFDFLAGHAYQKFNGSGNNMRVFGFEVDDILYTNNLQYGNFSNAETSSYAYERELQSFFGRVNYALLDKYMFTATARMDGSSKFGENKKYGSFPSMAFAWRASEENFIADLNAFSNLKIRLGWGKTGNQEIPDKISLLAVGTTPSANGYFNGMLTPGITFLRTPNPDIQWETTTQTNIGIDFGFWNNRLSGTFDYFNKVTKDVLLEIPSQAPAATQTQWQNVPDLEIVNNGIELGLDGIILLNDNWNWSLGVNYAYVNNEVKKLPVKLIETGNASGQGLSGTRVQIITNGQPIGTFYGRVFEGFDANGISQYKKDAEGNDALDYLGSALPDFTYSFSTKLQYKKLDFSMFWYGSEGNKVYNNTANALFVKGTLNNGSNVTRDVFKSNESPSNSNAFSSRFVEDGSFLRLSNITLGYTINTNAINWLGRARVYVTGNNLLLFTKYSGYDPEVSVDASENGVPSLGIDYTAYPKPTTFTFGVNIQF